MKPDYLGIKNSILFIRATAKSLKSEAKYIAATHHKYAEDYKPNPIEALRIDMTSQYTYEEIMRMWPGVIEYKSIYDYYYEPS